MVMLQHVDTLGSHSLPFEQLGMKHATGVTMDKVRNTPIATDFDPLKTWSSTSDIPLVVVTTEASYEDDISVLKGPYFDDVAPAPLRSLTPHPIFKSTLSTKGKSRPCCQAVSPSPQFGDWPSDEESEVNTKFAGLGSSRFELREVNQGSIPCRPLRQHQGKQERDDHDENSSSTNCKSRVRHSLSRRKDEENDYRHQPAALLNPWHKHRHE